jgi:hypothetical protein
MLSQPAQPVARCKKPRRPRGTMGRGEKIADPVHSSDRNEDVDEDDGEEGMAGGKRERGFR